LKLLHHSTEALRASRLWVLGLPHHNGGCAGRYCRKLGALLLVVAALGLPINDLPRYGVLIVCAIAISVGAISRRRAAWLGALAAVVACMVGQTMLAAPRIEEGHNVFLIDGPGGALEKGLPPAAFQFMAAQFNARYPPEQRCDAATYGCWRGQAFPTAAYAFSSDGIYSRPAHSRRVSDIDFADPVWLRLGFINEKGYNWNSQTGDIGRATRDRHVLAFLHRWRLEMPWFVMYRFPAAFAGSSLCWRGEVLWGVDGGQFDHLEHASMQCRRLAADDFGRQIFGLAIIGREPLHMQLAPTARLRLAQLLESALSLLGAAAVLLLLVRWRPRGTLLAVTLVALTLLVALLNDASFIGGVRPFDGGDDGLVYDGMARIMLRQIASGDIAGALEGGEKIFYFTPGLRYLRVVEHLIFGESYLGYLSLILLLPFLVLGMFRRFLPKDWALVLVLIFVAFPLGVLFGSSLVQYVQWAARGFADPAAYVFFLAGLMLLVGRRSDGPATTFAAGWAAGLLFAIALFTRPNIAPAALILLAGSGLAALYQKHYQRTAGLLIGFLPVLGMALHNWFYGGELVLFTATASISGTLVMPPAAYVGALSELFRFELTGQHLARALHHLGAWLAGPSEWVAMAPVNAAAIALLLRVALWKQIDPWLRLIAWATLAQQCVGIFYAPAGRYYYLTWLLTLLVASVWLHREGLGFMQRRYPQLAARLASHPARLALTRAVERRSAANNPSTLLGGQA
jgi:hypothetical protein